ncbi:cleft lip and palate transmembrane family protein [Naegleria gruberi]|uniref:Cleft lip and palate transmembrane family protein n=1 Tax=Naegleria gruberi TaxID=5762 RepID=D2W062_NAEGR|nr:cleft lip and palate transmembrane family protein [Naegleria gruberi]EFC37561.1 cleft lip and palate transmembrane family protein [Naegleria gruberi]|eukprot:XP_002670305.1 cleft lip and palate transmembrane family protein [Naegleria gruberi strain NEG-M]
MSSSGGTVAQQSSATTTAARTNNEEGSTFSTILSTISRVLIVFFVMKMISGGLFGGGGNQANNGAASSLDSKTTTTTTTQSAPSSASIVAAPAFRKSCAMTLQLYLSTSSDRKLMRKIYDRVNYTSSEPIHHELLLQDRVYYDDRESNHKTFNLTFNNQTDYPVFYDLLIGNKSVHFHAFLQEEGNSLPERILHITHPFSRVLKVKRNKKRNLLFDSSTQNETESSAEVGDLYIPHYLPKVFLSMVDMHDALPLSSLPAHFQSAIHLLPMRGNPKRYYPVLYFNDFWTIRSHFVALNDTLKSLPLELDLSIVNQWKWQFHLQMDESLRMQKQFGSDEAESDEIKRMLFETNPYLLAITIVVSILHSVFDFLAFKNDIQFYRNQKNMEGLSIRSIFVNCFFQTAIFLYLFDNETSWMILISNGIGLLIEYWKISKVVDVSIKKTNKFPYFIEITDKSSYVESKTKEYDNEAITYLSYVFYPLIVGYAIYALYNHEFRSWYSFVLSTIVGFIYVFGFLNSVPQVYVNYKLKSVAAMPWKSYVYKALNTFVDDLFAFVIQSPNMYKLACLRDDVIFFIYLYQRWIYPVDLKRVNEFGQGGEEQTTEKQSEITETTTEEKVNEESTEEKQPSQEIVEEPSSGKLKTE